MAALGIATRGGSGPRRVELVRFGDGGPRHALGHGGKVVGVEVVRRALDRTFRRPRVRST